MNRRSRQLLQLLLVAIFWIAQVQGTVHNIGHIRGSVGASNDATAPHSALCVECTAFAQAGAAPILALPASVLAPPTEVAALASAVVVSAEPASAYQSRAPPISPI